MIDVENDKMAREPIARMLKEVKKKTAVNFKGLHRMIDFQLFLKTVVRYFSFRQKLIFLSLLNT